MKRFLSMLLVLALLAVNVQPVMAADAEVETASAAAETAIEPQTVEEAQTEEAPEAAPTPAEEETVEEAETTETPVEETPQEETAAPVEEVPQDEPETPAEEKSQEEKEPAEEAAPEEAAAEDVLQDISEYPEIEADVETQVELTSYEGMYFQFTPEYTESYTFYSVSGNDPYAHLYNSSMGELSYDDDGGEALNFSITYTLEAGTTYIFNVCDWDEEALVTIVLQTNHDAVGEVTKEATCAEDGLMTYICSACGAVYTEVIPAQHTFVDGICTACGAAFNANGTCGDNLLWYLDKDGVLTITGQGEMDDFGWYEDVPWYDYADQINKVVIEEGITSIGSYAFYECSGLIDVEIPDSVSTISYNAFYGCRSLTSISIPDSVTTIDFSAFIGCSSLTNVKLSAGMTEIQYYTFYGCSSLKSIIIPDSVTSIGDWAFSNCSSLESISLPEGVTYIGWYAFEECSSLTEVEIPASVETIDSCAFSGCSSLEKFIVDEDNENYSSDDSGVLFDKAQTVLIQAPCAISGSYVVPDTVETIYDTAFAMCKKLTHVIIPASVAYIGYSAFTGCSGLEAFQVDADNANYSSDNAGVLYDKEQTELIRAPGAIAGSYGAADTVTVIAYEAFANCKGLAEVALPDSLEQIGQSAFYGCSGLTDVAMSSGLVYIGYRAFFDCVSLTEISIPESVEYIDINAFYGCDSLTGIYVSENNENYSDINGALCDKAQTELIRVPGATSGSYEVPGTVTYISYNAFADCSGLTGVVLPDTLEGIGATAFEYTGITEIIIPASVTYVEDLVFEGSKLNTVVFAGDAPEMWDTFYGITATAHYPAGNSTWTEEIQYYAGGNITWVPYSMWIISQPTTQKVKTGTTAKFSVEASGSGLSYQWQYKTSSTGSWLNCTATGNKTANMSVAASTSKSGYRYRCKITDSAGNTVTTNTVYLYVLGVTSQPTTQKVKAGTTATFAVSATGHNKTYQWQYKTSSSGSWLSCTATGNKTATLKVSATTGKSGYMYRCKITDSAGNIAYTNTAYLYVLGVKTQPATTYVKNGNTATFTVSATGHNKTYQWQYRTSSSGTWKNTTATGYKTATLKVSATTAKNGYQYRCKITDSAGNIVYTNAATMYVLGIKTQPSSVKTTAGSTAKFTVSATGGGLSYQWQYRTSSSGTWKNTTATGNKTATLKVAATKAKSGYQYRCVITDSAGNVVNTNAVTLTVK